MIPAWLAVANVLALLVGALALLRWYSRRYAPHPEVVRKLLHIAMGLVAASFPWVFEGVLPVLALFALTLPLLIALRRSTTLQRYFGGVIDGVERRSLGDLVFPAGICVTYVLAGGDALSYCLPVVVLALADPAAALAGLRFGRVRYPTLDGWKTVEGSLAFFAIALLASQTLLAALSGLAPLHVLLGAALLAGTLTIVEGVSWAGLDNLFLPIAGWGLLQLLPDLSLPALIAGCALVGAAGCVLALGSLNARSAAAHLR